MRVTQKGFCLYLQVYTNLVISLDTLIQQKGVMGRALERVCVAPDHKIILSTKIRINQVEMCYRIPVDMTDSESFIAIDELKFSERQASSSPKLFFSAECLKNS